MGFLDFFRPKWRHSDVETRTQAVRDLADDDLQALLTVAKSDPELKIRKLAVKRLHDPMALRQVADAETDEQLRDQAAGKADELLVHAAVAKVDEGENLDAMKAVELLEDARSLAAVVKRAAREDVRATALSKLKDQKLLVEVVLKSDNSGSRDAALEKLREPSLLAQVARESDQKTLALVALERVDHVELLANVAAHARVKAVRQAAQARLPAQPVVVHGPGGKTVAAPKPAGPSPAELKKLKQKLLQVCLFFEPFARGGHDWTLGDAKLIEANEKWADVGEVPGVKQLEERFEKAKKQYAQRKADWLHEQELKAQKVKEADARRRREADEAAAKAEAEAQAKVHAEESERRRAESDEARRVERAARDAQVKEESLEEQLRSLLLRAEKLAERERFPPERLDELENEWKRLDPHAAPAPVPAPVADLASAPSIPAAAAVPSVVDDSSVPVRVVRASQPPPDLAGDKLSDIDAGWDDLAAVAAAAQPVEHEPEPPAPAPVVEAPPAPAPVVVAAASEGPHAELRQRFFAAIEKGRARAAEVRAQSAAERAAAVAELVKHAERLEKLLDSNDGKKLEGAIKNARGELKAHKPSPGNDAADKDARDRLAKAIETASAKLGERRDAETWRRWANLPKFETLINEAETLIVVMDEATDEQKRGAPALLRDMQQRWKDAGALPQEKSKALWERFKKACDAVYAKSRAGYAALDAAKPENLAKKVALCEKAEALKDSDDWKVTSDALKALQDEWKAIGPVPDEQKDEIWKRFRAALDAFYERRKTNDASRDEERAANLKAKEELGAAAERLSSSTNWRDAGDEIKGLQEEWKQVGPVPRAEGDAIWKRFRAACDRFFEARSAAFSEMDAERAANLEKKMALIAEAEGLIGSEDHEAAMESAKELQRRWKNIGHVPREQSDEIWSRFRGACDKIFEGPEVEPEAPSAPSGEGVGIGGFVNRIDLSGLKAKLAAAESSDSNDKKQ